MKKDYVEYLGFDDDEKRKVGRPKLADSKTKKKSLIIAFSCFTAVIILLIFGYGTLFGFNKFDVLASASKNKPKENVLVEQINPLVKDLTLKVGTSRKAYLSVLPASASNKNIKYKSSDISIAKVDKNGVVSAVSQGNAIVTAWTTDGSLKSTTFNIKVIKNASGKCDFASLTKVGNKIEYAISCDNAKVKEIQYKVGNENYKALSSKKNYGDAHFSSKQLDKKITFKVVYYPNNSKVTKYSTKELIKVTTTKEPKGSCILTLDNVKTNSIKYDITCDNAGVSKIAYKIGNGSYIGIDSSSLADTILFEESEVTRIIYFSVDYIIDGSNRTKTITKNSIILNAEKIDDKKEIQEQNVEQ